MDFFSGFGLGKLRHAKPLHLVSDHYSPVQEEPIREQLEAHDNRRVDELIERVEAITVEGMDDRMSRSSSEESLPGREAEKGTDTRSPTADSTTSTCTGESSPPRQGAPPQSTTRWLPHLSPHQRRAARQNTHSGMMFVIMLMCIMLHQLTYIF